MRYASLILVSLLACVSPDAGDTTTSESGDATTSDADDTTTTTDSGDTTTSESGDTSTDSAGTETGEMCTGELCNSSLTLSFAHTLPLLEGPHRLVIETPLHELICGVEASLEGAKSCFGFAFTDLSWTSELITVLMTNPFYDTVENPEALPFETVAVRVERGQEVLWEAEVPIEGGEAIVPDPCGPTCWHAVGDATIE